MTKRVLLIFLLLNIVSLGFAQDEAFTPNLDNGKALFKANCASCHNRDMSSKMTGPALGPGVLQWADYPRTDLYAWIRNSQGLVAEGHPRAVEIYNEYNGSIMTPFQFLTDQELEDLLGYIDGVYNKTYGAPAAVAGGTGLGQVETKKGLSNTTIYVLIGLLIILAMVLTRVILNMKQEAALRAGQKVEEQTLLQTIFSKKLISVVSFLAFVLIGFYLVTSAVNLGRQQYYEPEQPIAFSHKTHAGDHKIDCNYCHDGARRSKHSVIPDAGTCMKCHSAINIGSQFGTQEITKIYASIGWDPNEGSYIENYEDLDQDEVREVFMKWFETNLAAERGDIEVIAQDTEGAEEMWGNVVSSLTNDQKDQVQGPIEWVRVHNLPDHVYFNHAQHVNVAGLECATCHGPVEEMEVVEQFSPLSMGWCINCHRQTDITKSMTDNPYYHAHYHDMGEKVTVEDIGGLECQKCHY